jgi:hypothetical protein
VQSLLSLDFAGCQVQNEWNIRVSCKPLMIFPCEKAEFYCVN